MESSRRCTSRKHERLGLLPTKGIRQHAPHSSKLFGVGPALWLDSLAVRYGVVVNVELPEAVAVDPDRGTALAEAQPVDMADLRRRAKAEGATEKLHDFEKGFFGPRVGREDCVNE
jgi:hypothetical protein